MVEVSSEETVGPALVAETEAARVAGNLEEAELVNEIVAASTFVESLADELAGTSVDVEQILLIVECAGVETVVETAVVLEKVD